MKELLKISTSINKPISIPVKPCMSVHKALYNTDFYGALQSIPTSPTSAI